MEIDRNGLEVLERAECLRLLSLAALGRIAVTSGGLPTVLPVNYCVDDDRILVRTGKGAKLEAALHDSIVAFEVDHFDSMYHAGWSVVVTGRAAEVTDSSELAAAEFAPVTRWAPLGEGHVVAISTEMISGRRLGAAGTSRYPKTERV
jgi:nitroimidazol reductase NimA-like FMN-containing flavoprotein (pyridoxamine 5'-phosphate oxidase superfamily)